MQGIILQASDRDRMIIKGTPAENNPWGVDIKKATAAFTDCLAFIKRENPTVAIFNFIYTISRVHKIELYYALKGPDEISPMGIIQKTYMSMEQFEERTRLLFAKLELPE